MFTIDFTKPWLYKDIIYFNQGNLSTNNTLRCKLVTGGSDDFTGGSIACTFTTKDSVEISGFGKMIDAKSGIVDIVFPSNALVVGTNKLEVLVNRADGGVAQSPSVMYDIWQGLTTGNGIEAETNYPILIQLINSTNEASNKANSALNKANSMITDVTDAIDNAYRSANEADIATSSANAKIEEVETAKTEMIKKVDTSIVTMKSDVEVAKNEMASKTDEKIADVNRAIAAGTKDLEVKEARKDASGVVHDTLEQRLKSDLIVGDKSLKDFVIDMNGLKESQDFAYETDKGYLVCKDTQNGVVKDLKVHGKSLVNRFVYASNGDDTETVKQIICKDYKNLNSGKFTIPNISNKPLRFNIYNKNNDSYIRTQAVSPRASVVVDLDRENAYLYDINGAVSDGWTSCDELKAIAMFIQGEHVNLTLNSHFEGIASVGNGNEIEVLSRKEDGNLFNGTLIQGGTDGLNGADWNVANRLRSEYYFVSKLNLFTKIESDLFIIGDINTYDLNMKFLKEVPVNKNTLTSVLLPINTRYVRFTIKHKDTNTNITPDNLKGVPILFGYSNFNYALRQDKKTILFKDTDNTWKPVTNLRGIDENKCDILDAEKGKLVKKYNQMNINKNLNIILNDATKTNTIAFAVVVNDAKPGSFSVSNNKCICSKFKNITYGIDEVGFSGTSSNVFVFRINKTDLQTQDIEGCKKWLENNSFDIVYELLTYESYEINPIYPDSYDNETMISFGSGAIAPHASWKITSSLPNFVKELSNQIKQLQDQVYVSNTVGLTVALNTLDTKMRLEQLEASKQ